MKNNLLSILIVFLLFSCNGKKNNSLVSTNTFFDVYVAEDTIIKDSQNSISLTGGDSLMSFGNDNPRPVRHVNEGLPLFYVERTFLKGLSASTYDLFTLPGRILRLDKTTGKYELVILVPLTKNNAAPIADKIEDGVLYSNKIDRTASFNANFVIGGLKANANEMLEIIITDVAKSYVPNDMIDQKAVKAIIDNEIKPAELENYYYIESAVLTLIHNKKYQETSMETAISYGSLVSAGGKIYGCNNKFERQRVISVQLLKLKNLIFTNIPPSASPTSK